MTYDPLSTRDVTLFRSENRNLLALKQLGVNFFQNIQLLVSSNVIVITNYERLLKKHFVHDYNHTLIQVIILQAMTLSNMYDNTISCDNEKRRLLHTSYHQV